MKPDGEFFQRKSMGKEATHVDSQEPEEEELIVFGVSIAFKYLQSWR